VLIKKICTVFVLCVGLLKKWGEAGPHPGVEAEAAVVIEAGIRAVVVAVPAIMTQKKARECMSVIFQYHAAKWSWKKLLKSLGL
jgi:hypothetical protein